MSPESRATVRERSLDFARDRRATSRDSRLADDERRTTDDGSRATSDEPSASRGFAARRAPRGERRDTSLGVLVLAHGGSAQWNRLVKEAVSEASLDVPMEIAFGMGMHSKEIIGIQQAIHSLQREGVKHIVVIPLLISSWSDVMRQFEYLFSLREESPWLKHAEPLELEVPITMASPLNDDPIVAEVLLERAQALSQHPQEETVILVAHGPESDEDNARWLEVMERLATRVQTQGNFHAVIPVTLRDDASEGVKQRATRELRRLVREASEKGEALVVPLLMAKGGIEHKIPQRLHGLSYVYEGVGLLPHPKLSSWIAGQVRKDEKASLPVPGT